MVKRREYEVVGATPGGMYDQAIKALSGPDISCGHDERTPILVNTPFARFQGLELLPSGNIKAEAVCRLKKEHAIFEMRTDSAVILSREGCKLCTNIIGNTKTTRWNGKICDHKGGLFISDILRKGGSSLTDFKGPRETWAKYYLVYCSRCRTTETVAIPAYMFRDSLGRRLF